MKTASNTVAEFLMECGHVIRIKVDNFEYLRKIAKQENKSWRNRQFCHKCNKAENK